MTNPYYMFKSATLKLTVWYVLILVSISVLFSFIIYSIALTEVGSRIYQLQQASPLIFNANTTFFDAMLDTQVHEAKNNLVGALIITNLGIWVAGGFGSYYLARRTLRPIEHAHEAQSRFTSDASHELRTPLASMKIEIEVALRDASLSKQEMRELLGSNLEEVNKLTKLSHMLLQLSRLEHNAIIREKVDVQAVTVAMINRFDKTNKRIMLHDSKRVFVLANESNVEELVIILLDNALKYSPTNSTIDVRLLKRKNMSGFKVVNSGPGISAQMLPHIFARFYRTDGSRTATRQKGYGLGLSLAKKIVQLHGGELTVSSAPDHDTTFQVLLPTYKKN